MAITQLGLHGPQAAYPGFTAKSSAVAATADVTVIVPGIVTTVVVQA